MSDHLHIHLICSGACATFDSWLKAPSAPTVVVRPRSEKSVQVQTSSREMNWYCRLRRHTAQPAHPDSSAIRAARNKNTRHSQCTCSKRHAILDNWPSPGPVLHAVMRWISLSNISSAECGCALYWWHGSAQSVRREVVRLSRLVHAAEQPAG